jgi:hypothetical protein
MTDEPKLSEMQKKLAWETAIKRLDFEIDLLWRRGLYFWTFIAVTFIAYSSLSHGADFGRKLTSIFGFLLSLAWCLANMGSKYWQAVWEVKVKKLEIDVTGKLYGWIPDMAEKKDILKGRRFSVSRIAIAVSGMVTLFWLGILARECIGWRMDELLANPALVMSMTLYAGLLLGCVVYSEETP